VFFAARGHKVFRVSSAKASDLRKFFSRHTKTNGIDADTLARLGFVDPAGLIELRLPGADRAALDRRVRATDRLTAQGAEHKVRIKDLVRQVLPMSPLTGELGVADLTVLERFANPNVLVKAGVKRLTTLIAKASLGHLGVERAAEWIAAAEASLKLYAGHPAVAFDDLAAEIATEVRLLRAVQAELAVHAAARETAYQSVDPAGLARTLPGLAEVGGPALIAAMGDPARFGRGKQFRSFTGLVPKASETGNTDRKGQPMSKAGSSLLRTTMVRAADTARGQRSYIVGSSAARTRSWPGSITCRWSKAARTTSGRSASSPPTWPSEPGPSCTEARATNSATPTAAPSPPPRPRPSSPSSGPFPPTCGHGAGPRRRGRPPRTSTQDNRDLKRANGAPFPSPHHRPSPAARQAPRTLVRFKKALDRQSPIGNQISLTETGSAIGQLPGPALRCVAGLVDAVSTVTAAEDGPRRVPWRAERDTRLRLRL